MGALDSWFKQLSDARNSFLLKLNQKKVVLTGSDWVKRGECDVVWLCVLGRCQVKPKLG
jgi:hypothetical protein